METDTKLNAVLNRQKCEREYIHEGIAVLKSSFESYIVDILYNQVAEERINSKMGAQLSAFMKENSCKLYPEAVALYQESIEKGYPVRPFESVLKYTATYNAGSLLSLYFDRYEYKGGAHGSTIRRSDTYQLQNGRTLPLSAFFPRGYDYAKLFLDEILAQAKITMETNPVFFDNYEELIVKYFNPDHYFLTEKGFAIYYQQTEIAPYATGIVVFEIPYDTINKVVHPYVDIKTEETYV